MRRLQERRAVAALSRRAEPAQRSAEAQRAGRRRLVTTLCVAAGVVLVDQVTKSVALADLHHPEHVVGPFGLLVTFNSGAAFSLFTGATGAIVAIAVAVVVLLGFLAWRSRTAGLSVALGLILGGALGNLADRAFRGHHGAVVDFITLSHWPTFNAADACISIGAVVTAVVTLWPSHAPVEP